MTENNVSYFVNQLDKIYDLSKALVIHGNIRDAICYGSKYYPIDIFLNKYLEDKGYKIIGHYDLLDGLKFPKGHRATFNKLIESSNNHDQQSTHDYFGAPTEKNAAGEENNECGGHLLYPTNEIPFTKTFQKIRSLFSHLQCPQSAFIIYFSEYLFDTSGHMDLNENEKDMLILLLKLIAESGKPHLLVFVTDDIRNMPPALYFGNPFCKQILIPMPDKTERQIFIKAWHENYYGTNDSEALHAVSPDEEAKNIDNLALATDGMTLYDLNILAKISKKEKICISDAKSLVKNFKFSTDQTPWDLLSKQHIEALKDRLKKRVIGQDHAIKEIETMVICAKAGIPAVKNVDINTRPRGIFLFCGPTGVGKTSLAKALTEWLFKDENAMLRFDMSEYGEEHSNQKLIGSPPGYVAHEQGGQLTNAVKKRPFSVILFDEVEKMHSKIWDTFLQIFDDGRLTDGMGQTIYFSETVIILTSNIGGSSQPKGTDKDKIRKHYKDSVKKFFRESKSDNSLGRPEILNRIGPDNIIVFDPIDEMFYDEIIWQKLNPLNEWLKQQQKGFLLNFDDSIFRILREEDEGFEINGARGVENLIETHIRKGLALHLFEIENSEQPLQYDNRIIKVSLKKKDGRISAAFRQVD